MQSDSLHKFAFEIKVNDNQPLTEPYWLQYTASTGAYQYDSAYAGAPETPNRFNAIVNFNINGEGFYANAPVSFKKLDPVKGDVVQRLRIVPAISVAPLHSLLIFDQGKNKQAWLRLKVFKDIPQSNLQVTFNNKVITSVALAALKKGQDTLISVSIPTTALDLLDVGVREADL